MYSDALPRIDTAPPRLYLCLCTACTLHLDDGVHPGPAPPRPRSGPSRKAVERTNGRADASMRRMGRTDGV